MRFKMILSKRGITYIAALLIVFFVTMIFGNHFLLRANGWPSFYELRAPLEAGFYGYYFLSVTLGFLVTTCIVMFLNGGRTRLYGMICLIAVISMCLSYALGMFLFETIFSIKPVSVWTSFGLFQHPIYRLQYIGCQLASIAPQTIMVFCYLFKHEIGEHPFGNAHFANLIEMDRSGFFKQDETSIIIGKKGSLPIYSSGFEHMLCASPPGSGKTRSLGMTNLFNFKSSIVCNDVKLSLYNTTSGYREKVLGHQCFLWAPADPSAKTHRYNPLDFISREPLECMRDIQRLAHIFIPDGKGDNAFWSQASRQLFKTLTLYIIGTSGEDATFGNMSRLAKQGDFFEWLKEEVEQTFHLHPEFYRNASAFIAEHEKTRQSALADFVKRLELFDDPYIDAATSASDFDFKDLRKKKITIYVGFSDDDMERLAPILGMFWQQLISTMIQKVPDLKEEPYPLLCLMDEFSSLGRIDRLRRSLKLLREYRVRCILMLQYLGQTYEQYSHDEAKAFTNIKTKLSFATDDHDDAVLISKMLGIKTKKINAGSSSSQHNGMSNTKSYQYQGVPLLRSDEIMRLKEPNVLIMRTGHSPVKAMQYIWYKDRVMKKLVMVPVNVPSQQVVVRAFDRPKKVNVKKEPTNNDFV